MYELYLHALNTATGKKNMKISWLNSCPMWFLEGVFTYFHHGKHVHKSLCVSQCGEVHWKTKQFMDMFWCWGLLLLFANMSSWHILAILRVQLVQLKFWCQYSCFFRPCMTLVWNVSLHVPYSATYMHRSVWSIVMSGAGESIIPQNISDIWGLKKIHSPRHIFFLKLAWIEDLRTLSGYRQRQPCNNNNNNTDQPSSTISVGGMVIDYRFLWCTQIHEWPQIWGIHWDVLDVFQSPESSIMISLFIDLCIVIGLALPTRII